MPRATEESGFGAYLDRTGAIVESGEYVAALYESYAADQEWSNGNTAVTRPQGMPWATWLAVSPNPDYSIIAYGESLASLSAYCRSAQNLAEELWTRDLQEVVDSVPIETLYDC